MIHSSTNGDAGARILFATVLMMVSGFVATGWAQASAAAVSQDKARVYIYRYKQFVGSARKPSVYCDEVQLAPMDNGRFFIVSLAPGKHVFRSNDKQSGVELDVKSGQVYYLRLEVVNVNAIKGAQGRLVKTDAEQGEYEVKQLRPLDDDRIKDRTLVVGSARGDHDQAEPSRDVLTNEDVLALKAAGLSDETIIAKVRSSATRFSLATQDLIQLKNGNLSDSVIQAMLETSKEK